MLGLCMVSFLVLNAQMREVPVIGFDQLEPRLHSRNDTLYVVNFWATWCKPCVEELPYLEKLGRQYTDRPVRVLLVSLDFKSQLTTRLLPFLKKKGIRSEVVLLHDTDADAWIPKVSDAWDGAIPVTLFYRGDRREVHLEAFPDYASLTSIVHSFLSP